VKWERRFSSPENKREYVRRLFSTIAPRYDLITVLLSFGQDRRWKRRLASLHDVAGRSVLDLATGTGDIAYEIADRGAAHVVALDITHRMLQRAALKRPGRRVAFVTGDMMALPFSDASFDLVTVGYGLRNVPLLETAFTEAARVLRTDGVLLSLDFNKPQRRIVRGVYLTYLSIVGSLLGTLLHGDADTYRYIPESIKRWPGSEGVCAVARSHGFRRCDALPIFGGLMTLHRAVKE
jgi:demethylmenaquinone methyltransferase/2-methoxy-6-polyprenyl-1,4-benzoquinol methylase